MYITFLGGTSYGMVPIKRSISYGLFLKNMSTLIILSGIPITWVFLVATRYGYDAFDGLLWPQRFLAFVGGMIIFSLFTWLFKGEGISAKTFVCLALSISILFIQILWKS